MERHPTLVLLAAGVGRRFGGAKQTEEIGPAGEWLLEYSLYDALRAGFDRAVLVVHPAMEAAFRTRLAAGAGGSLACDLAYQGEPRGTAHALLQAHDLVHGPFAVANADDVYGPRSFAVLAEALEARPASWALVGFALQKTLSPHGPVSRAVLSLDDDGHLCGLEEHLEIDAGDALVSMNLWGFTPAVFDALATAWARHEARTPDVEFQLPTVINALIERKDAAVQVVSTPETWLGITWPDDRTWVAERLRGATAAGRYPAPLWSTR